MADAVYDVQVTDSTRRGFQQSERSARRFATNVSRRLDSIDPRKRIVDERGVRAGLTGLQAQIGAFSQRARRSLGSIGPSLKLGGVAAAGGLAVLGASAVQRAREIEDLSRAAQISAEDMQRLQFQAQQTGGEAEDIADAFREMQLRLAEAADLGSGPAVDALGLLGIGLEELEGLNAPDQFQRLRDAISEIEDPARRLFAAEELLGGSSERLQGVLGLTREEYRKLRGESDELNVATDETIERTNDLRRSLDNLRRDIETKAINVLGSLVEGLGFLTDATGTAAERLDVTDERVVELAKSIDTPGTGLISAIGKWLTTSDDMATILTEQEGAALDVARSLIQQRDATTEVAEGLDFARQVTEEEMQAQRNARDARALATAELETMRLSLDNSTGSVEDFARQLSLEAKQRDFIQYLRDISGAAQQASADVIATGAAVSIASLLAGGGEDPLSALQGIQGLVDNAVGAIRGLNQSNSVVDRYRQQILDQSGTPGSTTTDVARQIGSVAKSVEDKQFEWSDVDHARAEGRFTRLADDLDYQGQERAVFIAQGIEAARLDAQLAHTEDLDWIRRGVTYEQELTNAAREQYQADRLAERNAERQRQEMVQAIGTVRDAVNRARDAGNRAVGGLLGGLSARHLEALHESGDLQPLVNQTREDAEATELRKLQESIADRLSPESLLELYQRLGIRNIYQTTLDQLQGLADGGIVTRPTVAQIGEAGPEAVIPLSQLGGLGGHLQVEMTINIEGGVVLADDFIREVEEPLTELVDIMLNQRRDVSVS